VFTQFIDILPDEYLTDDAAAEGGSKDIESLSGAQLRWREQRHDIALNMRRVGQMTLHGSVEEWSKAWFQRIRD
jgi:hypothetical protein